MNHDPHAIAPGGPGTPPTWTSSAKSGIGKALNAASQITFTIGGGVINEVYFPREDNACTRDMQFVITDGRSWMAEESKDTTHDVSMVRIGIPTYTIRNSYHKGRFIIEKRVITDPIRNCLLQRVRFKIEKGGKAQWEVFALLNPHVGNKGEQNNGWLGEYNGVQMLFASRGSNVLAMACSTGWMKRSVGYAGTSDGLTDLRQHYRMTWEYDRAENGHIMLTGQMDRRSGNEFIVAIGFGPSEGAAAHQAWASLLNGFEPAWDQYVEEWKAWQAKLKNVLKKDSTAGKLFRMSAAVLRINEAKAFPGGIIASPSIPWGNTHGDEDLGGYHLVWPRDLVESSWGLLAIHAYDDAVRILNYVMATQERDGKWPQNMWLEGEPFYPGIQVDQVALPVLLAESCLNAGILSADRLARYMPGLVRATSWLVAHGPATPQDRWEQQHGFTPFTIAAGIAALLAAAALLEKAGQNDLAGYFRETADNWNDQIEKWLYVSDTRLMHNLPVKGYYIRINPFDRPAQEVKDREIDIHHHHSTSGRIAVGELVSVDALALVRFGLRAPDDERILDTIRVIDATLKVDLPGGSCWKRFTRDSYGEDVNGGGFHGSGIGRCWPLLTGERAHYELAAGHTKRAQELLSAMESFAHCSLLPEQVWDAADIPAKDLYRGHHSGSAMPLTWAHAEHIKLCKSIKDGRIFDMPLHTQKRYVEKKTSSPFHVWRFDRDDGQMTRGKKLRIEVMAEAIVHWSQDGWVSKSETPTRDMGIGIHVADIAVSGDPKRGKAGDPMGGKTIDAKDGQTDAGKTISFTFFWPKANRWENKDFSVSIV